jgi:hypothetical protein
MMWGKVKVAAADSANKRGAMMFLVLFGVHLFLIWASLCAAFSTPHPPLGGESRHCCACFLRIAARLKRAGLAAAVRFPKRRMFNPRCVPCFGFLCLRCSASSFRLRLPLATMIRAPQVTWPPVFVCVQPKTAELFLDFFYPQIRPIYYLYAAEHKLSADLIRKICPKNVSLSKIAHQQRWMGGKMMYC